MAADSPAAFERFRAGGLALVAGMLLPLAFAPTALFPLAVIAPALLFYLYLSASPRQAAWLGYFFGLGMFGVGVSWVYVAFHDFGFTSAALSVVLTLVFVAFLALVPATQGYLSAYLLRRLDFRLHPLRVLVFLLPALWVLFEWLRGWVLTGFPWLNLGYSQTDTWLSGYAPLLGVYGVSWLLSLSAGLLLYWGFKPRRRNPALAVFALIWLCGLLLGRVEWTEVSGKPISVSLVQGNVPQITKWDPAAIQQRLDTYAQLTREHWDSQLIVWPENAVTVLYHELAADYFDPLFAEAQAQGTDIIVGAPVLDADGERYYSSLVNIGQPPRIYNKRHLVPFGEFVPLEEVLRGLIGFFDLPMSGFSRGRADQAPLSAAGQLLAPSICYEDAFGEELIDFLPAATLLINGSNNAWYGDSFAPHQHLQISRMRSLETGRMLLRVTTNGISALVDHKGRILKRSPQFETYVISGEAQPRSGSTPYVRFGNVPVVILLVAILAWVIFGKRRRSHSGPP